MKALFVKGLLILGIGLLGTISVTACGGPKIVEVTHNYIIEGGEKRVIPILLKKNDRLDLTVFVPMADAWDRPLYDIGIKVDDPSGQAAVPLTRIGSWNFIVLAEEDGVYVVTLDNSYSVFTPKEVTLLLKYPER